MDLIRGVNLDTGGSSGAGKSAIGLAIAYVLDVGMPFAAKDQRCWYGTGAMSVALTLIASDGIHKVSRGSQYSLTGPDGKSVTGAQAVAEGLKRLFGVYPDMLGPLVYKPQSKSGRFLWMDPADKRDFLAKVLNLQELEEVATNARLNVGPLAEKAQTAEYRLKAADDLVRNLAIKLTVETVDEGPLTDTLAKVDADLQAAEAAARRLETDEGPLAAQRQLVQREAEAPYLEREAAADAARKEFVVAVPQELSAALQSGENRLMDLRRRDQDVAAAVSAQRNQLAAQIGRGQAELAQRPRLFQEQEAKRAELKKMEAEVCPTCERPGWKENTSRRRQLEDRLAAIAGELSGLEQQERILEANRVMAVGMVHKLDPKIDAFQQVVTNIRQQIDATREGQRLQQLALADAWRLAQDERRAAGQLAVQNFDAQTGALRRQYKLALDRVGILRGKHSEATLALKLTKQENERRQRDYLSRKAELAAAEVALETARGEALDSAQTVAAERDLVVMVRGFLTAIFDEILAAISDRANAILGAVANTAHVNLRFFTEAINGKGETRQQITTACTVGGFEADLESGNSGGMFSSVDLAVDRALAEIIGERSNCRPGWVFLDEAWEGLDAVSKESCMEMLRKRSEDQLILVIDHGAETKELFDQTIDVKFSNGISTVADAA